MKNYYRWPESQPCSLCGQGEVERLQLPVQYIYTDGSCLNNGGEETQAGIAVYFDGELAEHSYAQGLSPCGSPCGSSSCCCVNTNNKAELLAIGTAVEKIRDLPEDREYIICTDSQYSIDCIIKNFHTWVHRDWITAKGTPVANKELIIGIASVLFDLCVMEKYQIGFKKVKGHSSNEGNFIADRLARRAAAGKLGYKFDDSWINERFR